MNILLVWPKARTDPEWGGDLGAIAEPLALEYLAAAAQADGHTVRLLDLRLHPSDLLNALSGWKPDVVGVSAFSMHVSAAKQVFREAKRLLPGCFTVVGGHHATFLPEDFFVSEIDAVVVGEGVGPFRALLADIAVGSWQLPVSSVWRRTPSGFVCGGPEQAFDVHAMPLPDRTVAGGDRRHYFIDWMKPVALLRTSVGCPYRCTYCSLWQLMHGRYHMRRTEAVLAELALIKEPYVFLIDDEAFINRAHMEDLAQAIRASGIQKRFFAYCRIDTLIRNRDTVARWKGIGLERLLIGIDAISPKDLSEYRKRCTRTQIERGLEVAAEVGIDVFAQFVVNTDYTRDDFKRLQRFVEHHDLKYPSFTVLTPLPGTELLQDFDRVIERQPDGRPQWDLFDTQNAVTATTLPKAEFRRLYRGLYRTFKASYAEFHRYHSMPL